jgi:hypothetical protein
VHAKTLVTSILAPEMARTQLATNPALRGLAVGGRRPLESYMPRSNAAVAVAEQSSPTALISEHTDIASA